MIEALISTAPVLAINIIMLLIAVIAFGIVQRASKHDSRTSMLFRQRKGDE